ncbi:MAG: beta-eliminating lyase-related protein [Acidobacteriota bacterium]
MARQRGFRSDNTSGVCPEAWATLEEANRDHAPAYGEDRWTARATELVREAVGAADCAVFFLFTGTAANALALAALCPPHGIVGVTPNAHVLTDECGAPGFFGHGLQLQVLATRLGKLDPTGIAGWATLNDVHVGKPSALSLSQCTELGTVYSLSELEALRGVARQHRLKLHLDGARLANACASLGATPAEIAQAAGAHTLVLGGTKNGMMGSEALVFFDPAAAEDFAFRRKQTGQLASKQRFIAAPWVGMLESEAWLRYATRANEHAASLAAGVARLGLGPVHPCEANEVFMSLTSAQAGELETRGWPLYFESEWGGFRAVCSWDTSAEDVADFVRDLESVARGA